LQISCNCRGLCGIGPVNNCGGFADGFPALDVIAYVVVVKNTVVLVRHHYAEAGDVEAIFNEYLDDKTGEK